MNENEDEKKKFEWSELIIPLLAICYAVYTISDQYMKDIRSSSLKYGLVLAVPLVVLSIIDLAQFFYSKVSGQASPREGITGDIKTMLIVFLGVIGMIALIILS